MLRLKKPTLAPKPQRAHAAWQSWERTATQRFQNRAPLSTRLRKVKNVARAKFYTVFHDLGRRFASLRGARRASRAARHLGGRGVRLGPPCKQTPCFKPAPTSSGASPAGVRAGLAPLEVGVRPLYAKLERRRYKARVSRTNPRRYYSRRERSGDHPGQS